MTFNIPVQELVPQDPISGVAQVQTGIRMNVRSGIALAGGVPPTNELTVLVTKPGSAARLEVYDDDGGIVQFPEPGTGLTDVVVYENLTQILDNKTLLIPTIADFTSANHDHASIAQGGNIPFGSITGVVPETQGGTGESNYSTGDILFAQGVNDLSRLTIGGSSNVLTVVGGLPVWASSPALQDLNSVLIQGNVTSGEDIEITLGDNLIFDRTNNLIIEALPIATIDRTLTHRDPGSDDFYVYESLSQTLQNKTLTIPTIGDFQNALHTHENNPGGGTLSTNAIQSGILPITRGGLGIATTPTNGKIPIGDGTGYVAANISGTTNQVVIVNGLATITLSLPQDIHAGATPSFSGASLTAALNMNSQLINAVAAPVIGTDAANKDYVDGVVQGDVWQDPIINQQTTPPGSPSLGDRYIVLPIGTGAWTGRDNDIAEWNGSSWDFSTPIEGWCAYDETLSQKVIFTGASWVNLGSTIDHGGLQGLSDDDHPLYVLIDGTRGTYVGESSITTVGTIAAGTWQGTAIAEPFGGTNQTTYAQGDILYASALNTLSRLAQAAGLLQISGGVPAWTTSPTLSDYTNAGHNHQNVIGGGQLDFVNALSNGTLSQVLAKGNTTGAQSIVVDSVGFISLRDGSISDLPIRWTGNEGVFRPRADAIQIRSGGSVNDYFEINSDMSLDAGVTSGFMTFGAPGVTNGFRWQYDQVFGGGIVRCLAQPSGGNAIASFFLLPSGTQNRAFFQMRNASDISNSGRLIFDFFNQSARLTTDSAGTGVSANELIFGETGTAGIGGYGTLQDVDFYFSGVAQHVFDLNGRYFSRNGTAALPSHSFVNRANTGMWSPAANVMALSGSGNERFRAGPTGISFFASGEAAQATIAALTNNVTVGGTNEQIDNWTDLTTYSTDAAAIRNAVYQLSRKVVQLTDALRAYGLAA